jgi:hypothetical protein
VSVSISRHQGAMASWRPRIQPGLRDDVFAVLLSAFVAFAIGVAVVSEPIAALLPVVALGALVLLVDARARILFVVFGGLLILQSSDSVGPLKLAYLGGVLVSVGGALFALSRSSDWFKRRLATPLLRASLAVSALIMISFFISHDHGVATTEWLRDVAPYLLFALAPIFALDAQSAFSRKALIRLLVCAGVLATASFATYWLEQRHIAELPFSQFALSSSLLPAGLFAYAIATALHASHRRAGWLAVAVLVFALLIVTGTRETLILVLAPLVAVVGARRYLSVRFVRLALLGPVALLLTLAAAYSVAEVTHASTGKISERIAILKSSGTSSDASYLDREAQARVAADIFSANPIFGAGPGTRFNFTVANGDRTSAFVLDTPVDFAAKFGIVGLGVLVFVVGCYTSFMRLSFRFDHPRPETLALAAYAVVVVAGCMLGNRLEDKGFSLGLMLLLALVLQTSREPVTAAGIGSPSS